MIEKLDIYHNNQDDFSNKINEIISHLNQQEEKNKPCEHYSRDKYSKQCDDCGKIV